MDNAECNARAFSAPVNMFGFALIKNQCLQGKGWQLVEREVGPPSPSQGVPSVEIDPRIKQANASYERGVRELCGSERYKTLFANTACFANEISLHHMASAEKLNPADKAHFLEWRSKVHNLLTDVANTAELYDGRSGRRVSDFIRNSMIPGDEKNELDLYDGKITWGEYNRLRKDLGALHVRELNAISSR